MKKNMLKKILLIVMMLCSVPLLTYANAYIPDKIDPGLPVGTENINNMTLRIIGSLMWIGYAIALGTIIYVGIKYVMASADEKASLKGLFTKIIIGTLIIVSAVTITNIVLNAFAS